MDKVIELAQKLKALTEQGIGGEKVNARRALGLLMKKHNITFDQIESPEKNQEIFKCKNKQRKILGQVMSMILDKDTRVYTYKNSKCNLVADVTKSEYIEIKVAFDFYWEMYEKDLKIFTRAFIQTNNLLPKDCDTADFDNMSKEELKEIEEMQRMAQSMKKHTLQKRLNA